MEAQTELSTREANVESGEQQDSGISEDSRSEDLDAWMRRFLLGFDYGVIVMEFGRESEQAAAFRKNHPSAETDLAMVREDFRWAFAQLRKEGM